LEFVAESILEGKTAPQVLHWLKRALLSEKFIDSNFYFVFTVVCIRRAGIAPLATRFGAIFTVNKYLVDGDHQVFASLYPMLCSM
jgi:hypothetical protein